MFKIHRRDGGTELEHSLLKAKLNMIKRVVAIWMGDWYVLSFAPAPRFLCANSIKVLRWDYELSRFGLAVRRLAGKQRDLGSNPLWSPYTSKIVVCGHSLVTLSLTINETLKWLSSLPTLIEELFWWWQCNDRYIISLSPHLHTPFPLLTVSNKPYSFCGY